MKHLAGVAAVLLVAGCGGAKAASAPEAPPTPAAFTASGTMTVDGNSLTYPPVTGAACYPDRGYDDIRPGTQVVVTDVDGQTVALGELGSGTLDVGTNYNGDIVSSRCAFPFTVAGIPVGVAFYGLEVGHRGSLQYTEAALRQPLSLGMG